MNKELVEALLPLVNDEDAYSRLQEFITYQIEEQRNELEKREDAIPRGALVILRRMQKLKEIVHEKRDAIEGKR